MSTYGKWDDYYFKGFSKITGKPDRLTFKAKSNMEAREVAYRNLEYPTKISKTEYFAVV